MKKRHLTTAARIALGGCFAVGGLNGFFPFFDAHGLPREAQEFKDLLVASGFMTVESLLEVVFGTLLIGGLLVPLSLAVLMPVVCAIFLFHFLLAPAGLPVALFILGLHLYLAYVYRSYFSDVLTLRARPYL